MGIKMWNVQLVDSNGSIVRTHEASTQMKAYVKADQWIELFPFNVICIENIIIYDGRKDKTCQHVNCEHINISGSDERILVCLDCGVEL